MYAETENGVDGSEAASGGGWREIRRVIWRTAPLIYLVQIYTNITSALGPRA